MMWKYKTFFGEKFEIVTKQLTQFLNEKGIKDFRVVMSDVKIDSITSITIVYLEAN